MCALSLFTCDQNSATTLNNYAVFAHCLEIWYLRPIYLCKDLLCFKHFNGIFNDFVQ